MKSEFWQQKNGLRWKSPNIIHLFCFSDTIDAVVVNGVFENILPFLFEFWQHWITNFSSRLAWYMLRNWFQIIIFHVGWYLSICSHFIDVCSEFTDVAYSILDKFTHLTFGVSLPFVVKGAKWKPAAVYVLHIFYFEFYFIDFSILPWNSKFLFGFLNQNSSNYNRWTGML